MSTFRQALRKVIPLRASTYEQGRKKIENRLNDISSELRKTNSELAEIKSMLRKSQQLFETNHPLLLQDAKLLKETAQNQNREQAYIKRHLAQHRENLDRANRELLQVWKAMPIEPLNPQSDHPHVIASYTTFPARIEAAYDVAIMLFHQTRRPDRIMLWLASDEFPGKEDSLPDNLLALRKYGLEICWCEENIKGHKKYYYTMLDNPEDIVITFDDDLLYEMDLVERLMNEHAKTPDAIIASRAHKITFSDTGWPLPYKQWEMCTKDTGVRRMNIMATNGAGSLFPPHSLHEELFNLDNLKEFALNTDDLWIKIMSVLAGTETVSVQKCDLFYIEGTQEIALWHDNVDGGNNDRSLTALLTIYNKWNDGVSILESMNDDLV